MAARGVPKDMRSRPDFAARRIGASSAPFPNARANLPEVSC
jgi:hypothetical protein